MLQHKIWERKGKTLTNNWGDLQRKGTHKHNKSYSKNFDDHKCLSQSEESKCKWTHNKMVSRESFWKMLQLGYTSSVNLISYLYQQQVSNKLKCFNFILLSSNVTHSFNRWQQYIPNGPVTVVYVNPIDGDTILATICPFIVNH